MLAIIIVTTSVASAMIALMLLSQFSARRAERPEQMQGWGAFEQTVFLFDNEDLVDATAPARGLLEATPIAGTDWARLAAFLIPRFENFVQTMGQLAEAGRIEMVARLRPGEHAPLRLVAESVSGLARITLIDPEAEGHGVLVDTLSQRALEDELGLLRSTVDRAPILAWRESADGSVTWANRGYILRSGALANPDEALVWPLPQVFAKAPAGAGTTPRRMKLDGPDERSYWFDCHTYMLEDGALHFAIPADATVKAERALRDFVQTLTKTFADLPIGLAIFDRSRQLQLFNPALIDLLGLGPEFLSARPTLYAILDRLRETRMMPEPKDYRHWRQQMTALEQAAAAGYHAETWSLPSGQTYRVTGRPHPDGAVAFLFEDISAEVSLTRRFRTELELGQEVLDLLDEAVAVFQPSGDLVMSNGAYARLWGVDPAETLGRMTIMDAVRHWQGLADTGADDLAKIRVFATQMGGREAWDSEMTLTDGRVLSCRVVPMTGGATLVGFKVTAAERRLMRVSEPVAARLAERLGA